MGNRSTKEPSGSRTLKYPARSAGSSVSSSLPTSRAVHELGDAGSVRAVVDQFPGVLVLALTPATTAHSLQQTVRVVH